MQASTISTILSAVTTFVTEAISWITSFAGAITSTPLLLTFVLVGLVGMGVGLLRRLMKV